MNLSEFWSTIEKIKDGPDRRALLREALGSLEPAEVVSFQEHFDRLVEEAYRWDLWGAAHLIDGGCSDDGFTDFRYGLISRGREIYEAALKNPDLLANFPIAPNEVGDELFGYVALKVYEEKTGSEMPRQPSVAGPEPTGEEWDFDDEEEWRSRFPRLIEKLSAED